MATISRLLTDEFYLLYGDSAQVLSDQLAVANQIDYQRLAHMHAKWLAEVEMYLDSSVAEADEEWDHALAVLAVDLCACECVRYSLSRPVIASRRNSRRLLIQNAAIYTGLQFVRTQHMELRIKNNSVHMEEKLAALSYQTVSRAVMAVKTDYRAAANFVSLLGLPR
jgi:hypothetical protein